MAAPVKNIEEFFLKVFKGTILLVMGVALVAILCLVVAAGYEFSQSPKEPPPAQKAAEKEIGLEELKTFLIEEEKNKNRKSAVPRPQPSDPQSLRFLEEATALYRCSTEFGRNVAAEVEEIDNQKNAQLVENLRSNIENAARGDFRGEGWVKAVVGYTCKVLADTAIISLRKEGKIGAVFYPTIRFHVAAWDKIQAEKQQFEQNERNRVAGVRESESMRVALAKAKGVTYLVAAGSAFGLFMVLALYLLAAKIETNLREISEAVRTTGRLTDNV